MISAGKAGTATTNHGGKCGGTSLTAHGYVDLEVIAIANFVELRDGLPGQQTALQLTPRDAVELARSLVQAAYKVDGTVAAGDPFEG